MTNVQQFTGAVNIEADVTPTTRQKIETVTPDKWGEMNIDMLWEQRFILTERMILAQQTGHGEIAIQLQPGLIQIDAILQFKKAEALKKEADDPGLRR